LKSTGTRKGIEILLFGQPGGCVKSPGPRHCPRPRASAIQSLTIL